MVQSPVEKPNSFSVSRYLKESAAELKKVDWPTKKQVINMSLLVLSISLITGLFITGLDFVFSRLVNLIIK